MCWRAIGILKELPGHSTSSSTLEPGEAVPSLERDELRYMSMMHLSMTRWRTTIQKKMPVLSWRLPSIFEYRRKDNKQHADSEIQRMAPQMDSNLKKHLKRNSPNIPIFKHFPAQSYSHRHTPNQKKTFQQGPPTKLMWAALTCRNHRIP